MKQKSTYPQSCSLVGQWLVSSLCILTVVSSLLAEGITLPKPDVGIVPTGPPGWNQHPGGEGFPKWQEGIQEGVPAIGFQTDMTFPNETIAILGEHLDGADFVFWAEEMTFSYPALRTAPDRAQIMVPTHIASVAPGAPKPVPRSVMMLWPHNSKGYGHPVRVNAPGMFWIWPGKKWTAMSDRSIRIFGTTLSLKGKTPLVVAQHENDAPVTLTIASATSYEIRAELPIDYPEGKYRVWVHNGTGGIYGWSDPGFFTVSARVYDTSHDFVVDDQVGETDQQKITAAIAAARKNGGGKVVFAERTYTITENIEVGARALGEPPIEIKGAGRDKTFFVAEPERWLYINGPGSRVENLTSVGILVNVRTNDVTIDSIDVSVRNFNGALSDYPDLIAGGIHQRQNLNLVITNSTFSGVSACCSMATSSYIRFANCKFLGRYHDGAYDDNRVIGENLDNQGISFRGNHKVIVEHCHFRSQDAIKGELLTRAIALLYPSDSHHVYMNNTMEWIGAFPSSPKRETNSGEVILFHGVDAGLTATVVAADWDSVTLERPASEIVGQDFSTNTTGKALELELLHACVVSGPAAGQVRLLKGATAVGENQALLQVSKWQNAVPRVGDTIVVRPLFHQNLVLNNSIDSVPEPKDIPIDFSRIGVLLWTTSHNSVIADNTIRHAREGIRIQSASGGPWVQIANHVRGNKITDCLAGGPYGIYSKFYADIEGGTLRDGDYFHAVGNVFRDNQCDGAEMGVEIGVSDHDRVQYPREDKLYRRSSKLGIMHSIVENNRLAGVTSTPWRPNLGNAISLPANWTLLRNNTMDRYPNIDFFRANKIYEALQISGTTRSTSEQAADRR